MHTEEIAKKISFIERTIYHAQRACCEDASVPDELKNYVEQMGRHSSQMQHALQAHDANRIKESVEDLARISDRAQNVIHPSDGMTYELKSAVILTHIELSALQHQLD